MSDAQVVVLAVAAMAGAWWARPVAGVVVALALVAMAAVRRPVVVLWVGVAVVASFLGARAVAGVRDAPTSGTVRSPATVVADPVWGLGGVRLELRLDRDGRRVQASAEGLTQIAQGLRSATTEFLSQLRAA